MDKIYFFNSHGSRNSIDTRIEQNSSDIKKKKLFKLYVEEYSYSWVYKFKFFYKY